MKTSDIILIVFLIVIALTSFFVFRQITNDNQAVDGIAYVYYNDQKILGINLSDGTYKVYDSDRVLGVEQSVYHVLGSNPYGVFIQYQDQRVRVIDEESPQHICQKQGWTNSPLLPLTCLPNNIIVVIESTDNSLPDAITG